MRLLALTVSVLALWTANTFAQTGDGPYGNKYSINKLTPNVFTVTWALTPGVPAIGNSVFIIGADEVVVVDTGFSKSAGEAILAALRNITGKPVSTVINTHWHGDHVFGNQVFRAAFPGVRFIAHPETRQGIITGEIDYRDANRPKTQARVTELKMKTARTDEENRELTRAEMQLDAWQGDYVLPDLLVDQKLTVMQGKRTIEIIHLGLANTKGDLVIHLPAERIAISGDMAITPIPFAFFSSPRQWIKTLDRLAAVDVDTIVPGHGPPQTSKQFIRDLQAMLTSIVAQVDAGIAAGQTLEVLQKTVKVVPPAGSVYEKASAAALDRLFRLPAIESAFKERQ